MKGMSVTSYLVDISLTIWFRRLSVLLEVKVTLVQDDQKVMSSWRLVSCGLHIVDLWLLGLQNERMFVL